LAAPDPVAGFCQEDPDMKSRLASMLPAVALALFSGAALAKFRIGTVGGGGRFTDSYWERQKKYEAGMESLRNELERARLE
jgi:hypothetical protein